MTMRKCIIQRCGDRLERHTFMFVADVVVQAERSAAAVRYVSAKICSKSTTLLTSQEPTLPPKLWARKKALLMSKTFPVDQLEMSAWNDSASEKVAFIILYN